MCSYLAVIIRCRSRADKRQTPDIKVAGGREEKTCFCILTPGILRANEERQLTWTMSSFTRERERERARARARARERERVCVCVVYWYSIQ